MSNLFNPYRHETAELSASLYPSVTSTAAIVKTDRYNSSFRYIEIDSTTASAFTVMNSGSELGSNTIEIYIIGGGGGGGNGIWPSNVGVGGGGGAGGFVTLSGYTNDSNLVQSYDVTIGAGGGGGSGWCAQQGSPTYVTPSTGTVLSAAGGGAGSSYGPTGCGTGALLNGGSGGGSSYSYSGGTGIAGQGNHGYIGTATNSTSWPYLNGGGGGAGEGGKGNRGTVRGDGGDGKTYTWMLSSGVGDNGYLAGGGGGGIAYYPYWSGTVSPAIGGKGGGGDGVKAGTWYSNGMANTGGGGCGGGKTYGYWGARGRGGNGGSGKVIVRWRVEPLPKSYYPDISGNGGETINTDGDYKWIQFTGDSSFDVINQGNEMGSNTVECLLVGGGGGGGAGSTAHAFGAGGGGGAGAVLCLSGHTRERIYKGRYPVTVGAGGAGANIFLDNSIQAGYDGYESKIKWIDGSEKVTGPAGGGGSANCNGRNAGAGSVAFSEELGALVTSNNTWNGSREFEDLSKYKHDVVAGRTDAGTKNKRGVTSVYHSTSKGNPFDTLGSSIYTNNAPLKVDLTADTFPGTGPFTIETWVNPSELSSETQSDAAILSIGSGAYNRISLLQYRGYYRFEYGLTNLSTYYSYLVSDKGSYIYRWAYPWKGWNSWNHVAICRYSNNDVHIFINGVQIGDGSAGGRPMKNVKTDINQGYFSIGGSPAYYSHLTNNYCWDCSPDYWYYTNYFYYYDAKYTKGKCVYPDLGKGSLYTVPDGSITYTGGSGGGGGSGHSTLITNPGESSGTGTMGGYGIGTATITTTTTGNSAGPFEPADLASKVILDIRSETITDKYTITDSSPQSQTVTNPHYCYHSTTLAKFGTTSIAFDIVGRNSGMYMTLPAVEKNDFIGNDFTMEAWIYRTSKSSYSTIMAQDDFFSPNMNFQWRLDHDADRMTFLVFTTSSRSSYRFMQCPLTSNEWHHVAITNWGGVFTMWVDGNAVNNMTLDGKFGRPAPVTGNIIKTGIGNNGNGYGGYYFQGYMENIRITKGAARYTTTGFSVSGFTPSAGQNYPIYQDIISSSSTQSLSTSDGAGGGGGSALSGADGYTSRGGDGGAGIESSITGTTTQFGGGGGGGVLTRYIGLTGGKGGSGGGGDGPQTWSAGQSVSGTAGTINTGGGGGGGGAGAGRARGMDAGGNGGSGTVIIKWKYQ